jgi:hypothetical protein
MSDLKPAASYVPSLPEIIAAADWSRGEDTLVYLARERLRAGGSVKDLFHGLTALEVAVSGGWEKLAEMLIEHGALVHKSGRSIAMRHACTNGAASCIDLLTRHGAIVSEQDIAAAAACKKDNVMLAVLKNCHLNAVPCRKVVAPGSGRRISMRDWLLENDLLKSAAYLFEEIGEPLVKFSTQNKPLLQLCSARGKRLVERLRSAEENFAMRPPARSNCASMQV